MPILPPHPQTKGGDVTLQFLMTALTTIRSVCSKMKSQFQGFIVSLISTIIGGVITAVIAGIILYTMYGHIDERRYHNKAWHKLPGDIWHTKLMREVDINPSKLHFGEPLSAEDEQVLKTSNDEFFLYVDYPISTVPMRVYPY